MVALLWLWDEERQRRLVAEAKARASQVQLGQALAREQKLHAQCKLLENRVERQAEMILHGSVVETAYGKIYQN
jgi:hypothetical protein